jgi:hypothetical protein
MSFVLSLHHKYCIKPIISYGDSLSSWLINYRLHKDTPSEGEYSRRVWFPSFPTIPHTHQFHLDVPKSSTDLNQSGLSKIAACILLFLSERRRCPLSIVFFVIPMHVRNLISSLMNLGCVWKPRRDRLSEGKRWGFFGLSVDKDQTYVAEEGLSCQMTGGISFQLSRPYWKIVYWCSSTLSHSELAQEGEIKRPGSCARNS